MHGAIARIDDFGRSAWLVLMVLGFVLYWPIGLAILAYIIWSRRMWSGPMGCGGWGHRGDVEEWRQRAIERVNRAAEHWERKRARWEERMQRHGGYRGWGSREGLRDTGNRAFDEYLKERRNRPADGPAEEPRSPPPQS